MSGTISTSWTWPKDIGQLAEKSFGTRRLKVSQCRDNNTVKLAGSLSLFTVRLAGWRAYNLGLGCGYSVLDVVKCFESVSNRAIPVEFVGRRDGDVASSYSDCNLAVSQLKWKATRTLTDMCKSTRSWREREEKPGILLLFLAIRRYVTVWVETESISIDPSHSQ